MEQQDNEFQPDRRTSNLWQHFSVEYVGGSKRFICNQCRKSYSYGNTSNIRKHIAKGFCPSVLLNQQNNEQVPVEHLKPFQPRRPKSTLSLWEHFTIEDAGGGYKRSYCNQCKKSFVYSKGPKVYSTTPLLLHIAQGACPGVLRKRQRHNKSIVWEHFTIEHVGGGSRRAYCKHCKKSYTYGKRGSTTSLLNHIAQGACEGVLHGQQNNEQVPVEQKNNEQEPLKQQNNEQEPVEQQNNNEVPVEQKQSFQPNRRKSGLWERFTIKHVGGGSRRAYCNHCKKSYSYSKGTNVFGYARLVRHIAEGTCPGLLRNHQNDGFQPIRPKSIVWEHFTIEHVGGGSKRAYCNHSKKSYSFSKGSKIYSTGNLLFHIAQVECPGFLHDHQNNEQVPLEHAQLNNEFQCKRRKILLFEHFSIEDAGGGSRRAYCNKCKKSYPYCNGSIVADTRPLRHHIDKGECQYVLRSQQNNEHVPVEQQDDEQLSVEQPQPTNEFQLERRKLFLFEHFTIAEVGGGSRRAYCNQCKQSYPYSNGSKVADTSRLRNHIDKGVCQSVLRNQHNNKQLQKNEQEPVEQPQPHLHECQEQFASHLTL